MKRLSSVVVVAISALALVLLGGGAAQGGPPADQKVTGSIQMSGPVQYVSFNAFETTPAKGSVNYTNFEFESAGSGVWVPEDFAMGFAVDPSSAVAATYNMDVASFTPISPTAVRFTGTGDCGCGWISTFTGVVSGDSFTLEMLQINAGDPNESYPMTASGVIAADGSVSGTWSDYYGGVLRPGTFVIADIGYEAFHYVATVLHADVDGASATFDYVIPSGNPYAGVLVYVSVTDGGSSGAGADTWAHNGGSYPVVAGNLTVHS